MMVPTTRYLGAQYESTCGTNCSVQYGKYGGTYGGNYGGTYSVPGSAVHGYLVCMVVYSREIIGKYMVIIVVPTAYLGVQYESTWYWW